MQIIIFQTKKYNEYEIVNQNVSQNSMSLVLNKRVEELILNKEEHALQFIEDMFITEPDEE